MLWWNDLGMESCSQSSVSLTAGTAPEQFLGRRMLKQEIQSRTKPRPLPCAKAGARQRWARCFGSSAGWYEGLRIFEVGWLKKCRVKQRQQATKQPGGRMESVNKSTSPYILCFRNSTLTQPYLFHKGGTKRDSTSLSFSPLTQRILRTLITS